MASYDIVGILSSRAFTVRACDFLLDKNLCSFSCIEVLERQIHMHQQQWALHSLEIVLLLNMRLINFLFPQPVIDEFFALIHQRLIS